MRVVDLRSQSATSAPQVEVRASAGAELLRLIGLLLATELHEFDLGAERVQAWRARVPDDLLAEARSLGLGDAAAGCAWDDKAWLVLSLLGAVLPEPAGVDDLLETLRRDPSLAWRVLLAHLMQREVGDPTGLLPAVVSGDDDAVARLREVVASAEQPPAEARALVQADPDEVGRRAVAVIERFSTTIWEDIAVEAMGPISRDVAHRRELLASGTDPAAVVLEATNGYELSDDPDVRRVVLLPSYVFRPWLVVGFLDGMDVEVISTVVAEQFLALPSEAPPPSLLKLFKALSDEGRLKLLRRMSSGAVSLTEATTELGVTKATTHHHLSILRQAGLVSMRGEGRNTRYALRDDPAAVADEALRAYVPPRR